MVISGDGWHAMHGWLWCPSTTNSSDPAASTASFDLAASGSSSGNELSDPCLCHRWLCFMPATYTIYAFTCYLHYLCIPVMILWRWIRFYVAIKLSLIPAWAVSWTDISFFINYAIQCIYLCDFVYEFMLCVNHVILFLHVCSGNENIIQNFRACNGISNDLP
jgi:hypothetical protein